MSDNADRASELEQLQRDQALACHVSSKPKQQDYLGIRICINCTEDIPKSRIKAVPETLYCTNCQSAAENIQSRLHTQYRKCI